MIPDFSPCVHHPQSSQTHHAMPALRVGERLDGILAGPLPGSRLVLRPVCLVHMCNLGDKRVVGVGVRQHRTDGKQDCSKISSNPRPEWESTGLCIPLEMVRAGDHWSRRMSKQMLPLLLMLGW